MRLIIEVKNPTEELTGHILLTLVVGYFADAQYDVKNKGYFAALNMTGSTVYSSFLCNLCIKLLS